ncbi:hypothetical protein B0T18DRAFT_108979 [Schizothecium vesticola]|uniref:Extracellular membrane protein CFEM domain-containing protein n=1 Tax=Schizothecium vesticola TaxID=314040 RepID=A0AA40F1X5_9PEZI|nr:hypothetical protein B0T18DRAFT_108979 [Schizothecium vesticola]
MKSCVLWCLPLFSSLSRALGLDVALSSCANTCLATRKDGRIGLEHVCQGGRELQNLVHCIFTECNAELYAPAVREVVDACVNVRWNNTIHTLFQGSERSDTSASNKSSANPDVNVELGSADHETTPDDTTEPHTMGRRPRTSFPEWTQDETRSLQNSEPVLADSPPGQNMGSDGSGTISNRSSLATLTLTVTKYVAFTLPGGSYSDIDNISSNATGSEHIGRHEGSNPPTPARVVVNDVRTVPMAPTPPLTPERHMDGPSTACAFVAKAVANIPGPTPTSFITITVPIVSVQQGGYTPPVTSSCESLGDGRGTGGTPGAAPASGPSGGPADFSSVAPPISYSYASALPSQVTASRGCRYSAFSISSSALVAQAVAIFFGISLAP